MYRAAEMNYTTSLESLPVVQNVLIMAPTNIQSQTRTSSGTASSSVLALLTTCIGVGLSSLPYAFMKGGLLFSIVVFISIMIMSIVIGYMLLESKHLVESIKSKATVSNYADLADFSFGIIGKVRVLMIVIADVR